MSRWLRDREGDGLGGGGDGSWGVCRRTRDVWKGRRVPGGVRNLAVRRRGFFASRAVQNWVAGGECVVEERARVQAVGFVEGVGILFLVPLVIPWMRPPPSRASNAPRLVRSMVVVL